MRRLISLLTPKHGLSLVEQVGHSRGEVSPKHGLMLFTDQLVYGGNLFPVDEHALKGIAEPVPVWVLSD